MISFSDLGREREKDGFFGNRIGIFAVEGGTPGLVRKLRRGTLLPPYSIIGVDGATPSKNQKCAYSFSSEIRKSELTACPFHIPAVQ